MFVYNYFCYHFLIYYLPESYRGKFTNMYLSVWFFLIFFASSFVSLFRFPVNLLICMLSKRLYCFVFVYILKNIDFRLWLIFIHVRSLQFLIQCNNVRLRFRICMNKLNFDPFFFHLSLIEWDCSETFNFC